MNQSAVRCFRLTAAGVEEISVDAPSLDALSLVLPQGVYTTFRTYHGSRALHLKEHIDRLNESAALQGHCVQIDHAQVRAGLATALALSGFPESRVRLTLAYEPLGDVYCSLTSFDALPATAYIQGVRCVTADRTLHRDTPRAKATSFIAQASQARATLAGVNEVLLLGVGGTILEGSSSNFYAVLDGSLRTAEDGVLAGITRGIVLHLADGLLPVVREPVTIQDLPRLEEAFITSVSRAVLPVVAIDDQRIGAGLPGPVTTELGLRFNQHLEGELEPILPG